MQLRGQRRLTLSDAPRDSNDAGELAQRSQNGASVATDEREGKRQVGRWRKDPDGGGKVSRDVSRTVPRQTPASHRSTRDDFHTETSKRRRGKRVYRFISRSAPVEVSTYHDSPSCSSGSRRLGGLAGLEMSKTTMALTSRRRQAGITGSGLLQERKVISHPLRQPHD